MKLSIFCIRDVPMGVYLAPFVSRSDVDAIRQIKASLADPQVKQTPVGQNPSDYQLYKLGDFDDETGITNAHEPKLVLQLSALKEPETVSGTVPS